MNNSNHVVTIPIEHYNKLMAAAEYIGLIELNPDSEFYKLLKMAAEIDFRQKNYKEPPPDILDSFGVTFYFKKNGK